MRIAKPRASLEPELKHWSLLEIVEYLSGPDILFANGYVSKKQDWQEMFLQRDYGGFTMAGAVAQRMAQEFILETERAN